METCDICKKEAEIQYCYGCNNAVCEDCMEWFGDGTDVMIGFCTECIGNGIKDDYLL